MAEAKLEIDGEHLELIGRVRTFDADIASFESRIKVLRDQIKDEIENTDEYSEVLELTEKLKQAREGLRRRLEGNEHYMNLTEELADEKLSLKDAKSNLSDFLLGYFAETHERQIELGPKNARELLIKAKLGKQKYFQTNIFSGGAKS